MASAEGREPTKDAFFFTEREEPTIETSYRIRLLGGNSNPELLDFVARQLKIPKCQSEVKTFANGEISIKILDNIRGDDCFLLQPTTAGNGIDVNTSCMELLLLLHTLKLSSARRITALIPYFAYSRQDRKAAPRVPISACAMAQLIQAMGVDRVITVDLHCGQIQGFFRNCPVDNLQVFPEFARFIEARKWFKAAETAIVSPDAGGVDRATTLANRLGAAHVVTILKRRVEAGKVESMQTVGNVEGFDCIIVDDMVDTAGTLVKACELLKILGARRVVACATHGILTHPALDRINACDALDQVIVSDSIPQAANMQKCSKLKTLSIAPMLAEAIARLHKEESISALFKNT